MNKSLGITLLIFCLGVAVGGASIYLVHIGLSADKDTENVRHNVKPKPSAPLPSVSENPSDIDLLDPRLHEDPIRRGTAIYTWVASLSEGELKDEIRRTSDSKSFSNIVQQELVIALIERLSITDSETALEFALTELIPEDDWTSSWYRWSSRPGEPVPANMPVVQSLFADWAQRDLEHAIQSAKTLDLDAKSNALVGILYAQTGESLATLREIAKELNDEQLAENFFLQSFSTSEIDDPQTAWNEAVALVEPDDFSHIDSLLNIGEQWYKKDGFSVLDEIRASTIGTDLINHTILQLLGRAAEERPEQALQYSLSLPGESAFPKISSRIVVYVWADSDPDAAYQAVSGIENKRLRENLQGSVISVWASNDPRYVLENLDTFPEDVQEDARADSISSIAETSPKEAAEVVLQYSGSFEGQMLARLVMSTWVIQDADAAIDWVFNGPVSEQHRYSWVSHLTTFLVRTDPRRAFDLAVQQEIPTDSGSALPGLEASVMDEIADHDLELALELLPGVREGITRSHAYSSIGKSYINAGDTSKAFNLGLELSDPNQAEYFQNISTRWARIDPAGLVESMEELPNAEIRSNIAKTVTSRWYRENFTEDQLNTLKQYLSDSE